MVCYLGKPVDEPLIVPSKTQKFSHLCHILGNGPVHDPLYFPRISLNTSLRDDVSTILDSSFRVGI